jgi:hypothetical protein
MVAFAAPFSICLSCAIAEFTIEPDSASASPASDAVRDGPHFPHPGSSFG